MKKNTGNPHSITLLGWHLSASADSEAEIPAAVDPGKRRTRMAKWPNDLELLPMPSLLLSAS